MKLTGIVILVVICISAGSAASGNLKRRLEFLRQLKAMLEYFQLMIRYRSAEISELICAVNENDAYNQLCFVPYLYDYIKKQSSAEAYDFHDAWKKSLDRTGADISYDDKELLLRIGSALGTTDVQGQTCSLEQFIKETENRIKDADRDYRDKGKLYRSLGIIAGAAAALTAV